MSALMSAFVADGDIPGACLASSMPETREGGLDCVQPFYCYN